MDERKQLDVSIRDSESYPVEYFITDDGSERIVEILSSHPHLVSNGLERMSFHVSTGPITIPPSPTSTTEGKELLLLIVDEICKREGFYSGC